MLRTLTLLWPAVLLAGCISFNAAESSAPDYAAFCQEKETQCRELCGGAGIEAFSCKAAPGEGLEYRCQCRKTGVKL